MTENGAPAARTEICVVGAGPRGISVTERLLANARQRDPSAGRLVVHLVDTMLGAGGRVWSVDQPDVLLMNTIASQITMFTNDSVTCRPYELRETRGTAYRTGAPRRERVTPARGGQRPGPLAISVSSPMSNSARPGVP
ncbi:hypothetical protein GCM10011583_30340 [Streptomyces camponoticapitis]|uniref:FAD-dependent urate hydroxylase HpyO/Asp monooxygenase CreE-like FAD/NAD(P)-binding domain-containing protein n=1 Tax=Streptomyces camponoticapitis TaxID=1616125 RepID=A0ABQ2E5G8_9ACTN|nr:FAD/NAD(P)-binding protein [Streptomyces camponoticapitis]GGJ96758.1 hypothetical protein GCM10011583_30340 [Streptomyces camponoticapitis]